MSRGSLPACALSLLLVAGCGADAPSPDAGPLDGGPDAASPADATVDAPSDPGGCVEATLDGWALERADDVSIVYRARITPTVLGQPWALYLELNRYATEYVGEFPLGEGMDANYGGCARCVVAFRATGFSDHALFAREGTLTLAEDPFSHRLDATLTGVVLEEVRLEGETLSSVPVPGGVCVTLADTHPVGTFPPEFWTCAADRYGDGERCDCACGGFDPDCGDRCGFPIDPSCDPTPLPVAGCAIEELCTLEARCVAPCDHSARVGCDAGVCAFSLDGDRCYVPSEEPVAEAALGALCVGVDRVTPCAVDAEGFAMGLCDPDDAFRCRPACETNEECTVEGEECSGVFFDFETGAMAGFCRPAPPECRPSGEPCSEHLDCCTVLCEGLTEGGEGTCG